jgi:hypothetical protein
MQDRRDNQAENSKRNQIRIQSGRNNPTNARNNQEKATLQTERD